MKLKRMLGAVCAAAVLFGVLSGCSLTGTKPIPKGMDKDALLTAGEEVVNLLLDGEHEAVVELLREDIRFAEGKEIKPEHIKELVETHADPEEVGTFVKIEETAVMGETKPEALGIALFKCEYTEKEVAFGIAYDPEMNLTGISIAHS